MTSTGVMDLTEETYETAHGGYDPVYANEDADSVLPVDVLRELEKEGIIGRTAQHISIQQLVTVQP
ncbi:MAG: glycine/betaine/sarcosine/D-proline family reductase selenoprotein B [Coprococcus sp.]